MENVFIELYDNEGKLLLPSTSVPRNITPQHLSSLIDLESNFYLNGQPIINTLDETLKHQKINEYENILKIKTALNDDKVDGNFCSDSYSGHEAAILCVHANKNLLVSGGGDSTVRFWCDITKTQKKIIKSHEGVVYSIDSNENNVVSAGSDGKLVIYNYKGEKVQEIKAHTKGIVLVKFINDLILTAGRDNYVKLFRMNGECVFNYSHNKPVTALAFLNEYIFSGGRDGKVKIFKNYTFFKELSFPASVNCLSVYNDYLIVGCENGTVFVYKDFTLVNTLLHSLSVISISISTNGMFFSTGSFDRKVKIFCLENQKLLSEYTHSASVYKVYCTSDKVISCSKDKCLMVYDLGSKAIKSRIVCGDEVYDFSVYNKGIVCGGKDRMLYFLN